MSIADVCGYAGVNNIYSQKLKTNTEQVSASFSEIVKNKMNETQSVTKGIIDGSNSQTTDKPLWNWYDGPLGFHAYVYKMGESDSEYMVKIRYDDGREEKRIVDVDNIDASNCDIVDLHLKMCRLRDEGKIDQEGLMMDLTMAHFYMEQRMPTANEDTNINFKSWYYQQLELEMKNDRNEKNIRRLMNLLRYL